MLQAEAVASKCYDSNFNIHQLEGAAALKAQDPAREEPQALTAHDYIYTGSQKFTDKDSEVDGLSRVSPQPQAPVLARKHLQ